MLRKFSSFHTHTKQLKNTHITSKIGGRKVVQGLFQLANYPRGRFIVIENLVSSRAPFTTALFIHYKFLNIKERLSGPTLVCAHQLEGKKKK